MAAMISEVYDASIASGAPEDKARKAAEAVAAYEGRFSAIDMRVGEIKGELVAIRGARCALPTLF